MKDFPPLPLLRCVDNDAALEYAAESAPESPEGSAPTFVSLDSVPEIYEHTSVPITGADAAPCVVSTPLLSSEAVQPASSTLQSSLLPPCTVHSKMTVSDIVTDDIGFRAITMPDIERLQAAASRIEAQQRIDEEEITDDFSMSNCNKLDGVCSGSIIVENVKKKHDFPSPNLSSGVDNSIKLIENNSLAYDCCQQKGKKRKRHDDESFDTASLDDIACLRRCIARYTSYFEFHFCYFCLLALCGGILTFIFENRTTSFIDTLFVAASACSMTGLSSVDFSSYTIHSQIVIMCLTLLGSNVLMSAVPLLIRRHFYHRRAERAMLALNASHSPNKLPIILSIDEVLHREVAEYHALNLLLKCIFCYYIIFQMIPFLIMGIYLSAFYKPSKDTIFVAKNPWYFALFHAISSFNNCGFGLLKNNMVDFQNDPVVLIVMSFAILLGNTFYPIVMRLIIWCLHKIANGHPKETNTTDDIVSPYRLQTSINKTATDFLLHDSRRCFTHMFGAIQTRSLLLVACGILITEFTVFMLLDYNKKHLASLSGSTKVLIGWFQSISTRTAGFNVINISDCARAMQLLWVLFMYVSSYPFIIAVRSSQKDVTTSSVSSNQSELSIINGTAHDIHHPNQQTFSYHQRNHNTHHFIEHQQQQQHQLSLPEGDYTNIQTAHQQLPSLSCRQRSYRHHPFFNSSLIDDSVCRLSHQTVNQHNRIFSQTPLKDQQHNPSFISSCSSSSSLSFMNEAVQERGWFHGKDIIIEQAQKVLLRDCFWLFLVVFILCITEDHSLTNTGSQVNVFSIIFEVVSAYGTVGLTLGYKNLSYSLSGTFTVFSKVIMIGVMIFGRHRGLPLSIDKSVNLPDLLNAHSVCPTHVKNNLSKVRRCASSPGYMMSDKIIKPNNTQLDIAIQYYRNPVTKEQLLANRPWLLSKHTRLMKSSFFSKSHSFINKKRSDTIDSQQQYDTPAMSSIVNIEDHHFLSETT